jgi:transcriptional regulator with XRE-family HTH domain
MDATRPPAIGPRLQAFRKSRGLTLTELAASSGISRSMLSEIERGHANPTYGTLWHLTRALDVDLNRLIGATSEQTPPIDRQTEHSTPSISSADGSCTLQILSPASLISTLEWYLMRFAPGGRLVSDAHAAGTTEHLHCIEGEIIVRSGGSESVIRAGETARYAADVEHSLASGGQDGAKAFLVVASASLAKRGGPEGRLATLAG